jgi:hypothetical protein
MNVCPSSGSGANFVSAQLTAIAAKKIKVQNDLAGWLIRFKTIKPRKQRLANSIK